VGSQMCIRVRIVAERFRGVFAQDYFSVRCNRNFNEQFPYSPPVRRIHRDFPPELFGDKKMQFDRFVNVGKNSVGALRQRIQPVFSDIHPDDRRHHVKQRIDGDIQNRRGKKTNRRNGRPVQLAPCISSVLPVLNRDNVGKQEEYDS